MAQHAHDDGFHEIQLNGKQLVFVFMAATVVSVVIFLCGVLVGRGVRPERTVAEQTVEKPASEQLTDSIEPTKPPTVQADQDPTRAMPPAPAEGGSAQDLKSIAASGAVDAAGAAALAAAARAADKAAEKNAAPVPAPVSTTARSEKVPDKAAADKSTGKAAEKPAGKAAEKPADKAADKPAEKLVEKTASKAPTAPPATLEKIAEKAPAANAAAGSNALPAADAAGASGQGWVVQVAATKTRGEADTIVKRLSAKGYAAFVLANNNSFRVRVGGYKSRKDADAVAARLKQDERVNPWVTR